MADIDFGQAIFGRRSAAKPRARDEARPIAANIASCRSYYAERNAGLLLIAAFGG
jgi:hypothetical protein